MSKKYPLLFQAAFSLTITCRRFGRKLAATVVKGAILLYKQDIMSYLFPIVFVFSVEIPFVLFSGSLPLYHSITYPYLKIK